MALSSTIYQFDIDLADEDRRVYHALALRVAMHPSESPEYLWTRVLAYALEYTEGIELSRGGISEPDDPPIAIRDLTGSYRSWIEIGWPDGARLHKASKSCPRVVVYVHKEPAQWLARLDGTKIHRVDAIEILAVDRTLIARLIPHLERRVSMSLSVVDRELYVSIGADSLEGKLERLRLR